MKQITSMDDFREQLIKHSIDSNSLSLKDLEDLLRNSNAFNHLGIILSHILYLEAENTRLKTLTKPRLMETQ